MNIKQVLLQQNVANFVLLHFARYCSDTPKVWWAMRPGFCCKFHGEYKVKEF